MRLGPVIEWGRRGIKEEGNLEGVDMYLPLGHTLVYRAAGLTKILRMCNAHCAHTSILGR